MVAHRERYRGDGMRLVDADALLKGKQDHEMISTHIIWNAPTIEAEPIRHGKWIFLENWETFECSVCGRGAIRNNYPYCMWCGAKMDEVTE